MIGVGTVMDAGTAALYIQLGANFVISPVIHEDVARMCNRRLIGWMPGCATLTEISRAQELGADFVKLFPGETLSPAFVKAALAPMPWTNILVTGGVEPTQESLKAWFDAGAVGVGMGSKLFPKGGRAEDVEEKVRFCIQTIQALKKA
jgi:2-dehydro-3-deoxyphosphogluconate aldolase/(4S)-4-hydroxy-2-oxoglutarate aldolase